MMTSLSLSLVATAATTVSPQTINWVGYLLVLLVALGFSVGLRRLATREEQGRLQRWVPAAHVVVWLLAGSIVILGVASFGFTSTLVLVVLFTVGVGVAALGWLRDVFAGLVMISESELHRGDHVEIGGVRGEVEAIGIRSLKVRDTDGIVHDLPHRVVMEKPVARFPDAGELALEMCVRVKTELSVEEALQRVQTIAGLAPLSSPRRRAEALLAAPPAAEREWLEMRVRVYPCTPEHREGLRSDVLRRLAERFDAVERASTAPVAPG